MAFYPCSNHHAPYRGPSNAAYPAIVDGASSNRRHLRMCQPCFGEYLDSVGHRLTEVNFEKSASGMEDDAPVGCAFCGASDPSLACFVTAYPKGTPERAYHGKVCAECEPRAVSELLLS